MPGTINDRHLAPIRDEVVDQCGRHGVVEALTNTAVCCTSAPQASDLVWMITSLISISLDSVAGACRAFRTLAIRCHQSIARLMDELMSPPLRLTILCHSGTHVIPVMGVSYLNFDETICTARFQGSENRSTSRNYAESRERLDLTNSPSLEM